MNFKVFVAGSQELSKEKDLVKIVANKMSVRYAMKGNDVAVLAYSSDDFLSFMSSEGGQAKYDGFIVDEADLVICLFKSGQLGGEATIKELALSFDTYLKKRHPKVMVLIEKTIGCTKQIEELNYLLSSHIDIKVKRQYYQTYSENALEKIVWDTIESRIKKVSPSALRPNVVELQGRLRQAQLYIDDCDCDSALDALKRALNADINDWTYFSNIAVIGAKEKTSIPLTELSITAYDRAMGQLLDRDSNNRIMLLSKRGGLKKRLAALQKKVGLEYIPTAMSALEDLNKVLLYLNDTPQFVRSCGERFLKYFYYDLLSLYSVMGDVKGFENLFGDLNNEVVPGANFFSIRECVDFVDQNYRPGWGIRYDLSKD